MNLAELMARAQAVDRTALPAGREGLVDEYAGVIVWLSSPMASYLTGVTVNVDGGTWAASGWLRDGRGGWTLNPGGSEVLI
jgi:NAD(P)-dependent dehydrogenase (short-subunit alcohol dehydrogenase family)